MLIGVSTSTIEEARRAQQDGASYCGVGPMFATATKRKDTIVGPAYLREYVRHEPRLLPHLAIGGITAGNIGELVAAGVRGVAVSSCVCGSDDPASVCRVLIQRISESAIRV